MQDKCKKTKTTPWHIKKHLIKTIYKKPTAIIILTGEKFKAFPLRLGIRQVCPLSPPLFDILLEGLANAKRPPQKKEIKSTQIKKQEIKLSLFANEIIIYVKNQKKIPGTNKWS